MNIIQALQLIEKANCGKNTVETILYYLNIYDKYMSIKTTTKKKHVEICEDIGVSEIHMWRIKKKVEDLRR